MGNDEHYKIYYALAVPKLCPSLQLNLPLAENRLGKKISEILTVPAGQSGIDPPFDAQKDKENIPGFCKEVLGAFGKDGRVVPDLLRETRKKS